MTETWRLAAHYGCDGGLHHPGAGIWLDPRLVREIAFVSHAHRDHWRPHRHRLTTPETSLLAGSRGLRGQTEEIPFGVPTPVGRGMLTLLPAGHILGAAQALVEWEGVRVLYTGDIGPGGPGIPVPELPQADVLIMETTYGHPRFRIPDSEGVVRAMADWCRRLLEQGITPVLQAYALGKTQRIMRELDGHGFRFALAPESHRFSRLYEEAGAVLPAHRQLDGPPAGDEVVICPPGNPARLNLRRFEVALVSGWVIPGGLFAGRRGFALSEHHDFAGLLDVVAAVRPGVVLTVHGHTAEFARTLRRRGVHAHPLAEREQLELFTQAS